MRYFLFSAFLLLASCAVVRPVAGGGFKIEPANAMASPGDTLPLLVKVALGAPPVVWGTNAGSITPEGVLTVPGCTSTLPMTLTVTATSGTDVATAVVLVQDKVTGITINPPSIVLPPGGTMTFTALVKTVCFPAGVAQRMRLQRPKNGGPPVIAAIPGV